MKTKKITKKNQNDQKKNQKNQKKNTSGPNNALNSLFGPWDWGCVVGGSGGNFVGGGLWLTVEMTHHTTNTLCLCRLQVAWLLSAVHLLGQHTPNQHSPLSPPPEINSFYTDALYWLNRHKCTPCWRPSVLQSVSHYSTDTMTHHWCAKDGSSRLGIQGASWRRGRCRCRFIPDSQHGTYSLTLKNTKLTMTLTRWSG